MANFTYGGGLVTSSENMLPIANQTGILLDQVGGTEHAVTDLQGTATLVTTNEFGFFADFISDIPRGVLMFGSYAHAIWSDTMIEQAAEAGTTASTALSTANLAKSTADAASTQVAGKADINHTHDGRYALLAHNHASAYATISHNHDGVYPPIAPPLSARGMSADQTLPNITSTPVTWGSAYQTSGVTYSGTTWTLPRPGKWRIYATVAFAFLNNTAWNLRELRFFQNSGVIGLYSEDRTAAAQVSMERIFSAAAGDTVRIEASQHTGSNLAIRTDKSYASLQWIGA